MFYFTELIYRLKFFVLSFFFLLIIGYTYYDIIFVILHFSYTISLTTQTDYYIYTHPLELYFSQIRLVVFSSCLFIFPYLIWTLLDFNKTSLYWHEFSTVKKNLVNYITLIVIIYIGIYYLIINYFFYFIEIFNKNCLSNLILFFFELKVQELVNFIFLINKMLILITFSLLIFFILINKLSMFKILKLKRIIYFFLILISTVLTPPDILSQISSIILLIFILEILILKKLILNFMVKS